MPETINYGELREEYYVYGFLDHLVTEECYTAKQLLDVLDKPERWQDEYQEFRKQAK